MHFLYPGFLWALTALSIPILIHLFNFRKYKIVFFSNLRFLRNLQEETQSRQKLKHLLVLAARLLAVAFLVLAFAQPYIPVEQQQTIKGHAVSVFIDNSFSMTGNNTGGELLELARNKAVEIAKAYKESDKFQLLTQDFEGRHQRLLSRNDFLELLDEIRPSPNSHPFSEVIARQKQALSKGQDASRQLYLLSDFQSAQCDFEKLSDDSSFSLHLLPLTQDKADNLYLDSCWFTSPYIRVNQPAVLMVRIRNSAEEKAEGKSVTLKVNGQQKALAGFEVEAGSFSDVPVTFSLAEAGDHEAVLSLPDYPITFDDQLYFSFSVNRHVNVLHIFGEEAGPFVPAIYGSDEYCVLSSMNGDQINYGAWANTQLIVLDGLSNYSSGLALELNKFMQSGGSVAVFPSINTAKGNEYLSFLQQLSLNPEGLLTRTSENVYQLNPQSELLKNVFEKIPQNLELPKVNMYYSLGKNRVKGSTPILSMRNGDIVFGHWRNGKGSLYVSGLALDNGWSSLQQSWLFTPMMLRMAYLGQHMGPLYYTMGRESFAEFPLPAADREDSWKLKKEGTEVIPEATANGNRLRIYFNDMIREAGNYRLTGQEDSIARSLSFNYSRAESVMKFKDGETLVSEARSSLDVMKQDAENLGKILDEQQRGKVLWKLCVLLALVFLLIEILLLKLYHT